MIVVLNVAAKIKKTFVITGQRDEKSECHGVDAIIANSVCGVF